MCRWNQQLEDFLNKNFKLLRSKVSQLRQDLQEMTSQVDNLYTSVTILTNMQGVLIKKIVECKVKQNSPNILASR